MSERERERVRERENGRDREDERERGREGGVGWDRLSEGGEREVRPENDQSIAVSCIVPT
jgi:hypothetical protein